MSTTHTASTARSESSRPSSLPAPTLGDAERVPEQVLSGPGYSPQHERWQLVRIRLGGRWRLGLLTAWWQPPRTGRWTASVECEDPDGGRRAHDCYWYSPQTVQLLEVPQGPEPVPAPAAVAGGGDPQ
ncbi:hypothetical protein ACIQF6_28150 [Kitasatospora sp. NPDC092948]|uniref:hypothetical protein n=1 Tax=Kitasatospora sp. NPDC092948 TaxID=3364088 RepID=UPI003828DBE9